MITFHEYEWEVNIASFYPDAGIGSLKAIVYGAIGMSGEVGEVTEKIKKVWRDKDGKFSKEDKEAIVKELGDVLFYVTRIAHELGYGLEEVAQMNVDKFTARKEKGTLQGSGDNR